MKRIGLMTFHAAHNYGSVLQAYATQKVLNDLGYPNEIINYRLRNQRAFYNDLYSTRFGFKDFLRRLMRITEHSKRKARSDKFEKFISERFVLTEKEYNTYDQLVAAGLDYPVLISGSDQVWNLHCTAEFKTEPPESILGYYLAFGRDDAKRISISSSFGGMTRYEIEEKLDYLSKFDHLSVREKNGADVLAEALERDVVNSLDPTLLLDKNEWAAEGTYEVKRKYVFVYTLKKYNAAKKLLKSVKMFADKHKLEVICVSPFSPVFIPGITSFQNCGPIDFISYIKSASVVITDSFHGTAFSVNMGTPFYTVQFGTDKRKQLLLNILGLEDRILSSEKELEDISDFSCSFHNAWERLSEEREKTINYIKNALGNKPFEICDELKCTGCSACAQLCPVNAISMVENEEGFSYPQVDFDKCIECGLCKRRCPMNNGSSCIEQNSTYMMGWHKDKEILKSSSSGGAFSALASEILSRGGTVFGAVKSAENQKVIHKAVNTEEGMKDLRGSKYFQSDVQNVYRQVRECLSKDEYVLFSGTACQIAGLYAFLGNDKKEKLLTIDVLCHGVANKKVVDEYIASQEKRHGKKITDYSFRVKAGKEGWSKGNGTRMKLQFSDGTEYIAERPYDTFFIGFNNNFILRESCYVCRFCSPNRIADFTIADFWGIDSELVSQEQLWLGVSLILANTDKARDLIPELKKTMVLHPADANKAAARNRSLREPQERPKVRDTFVRQVFSDGYDNCIEKIFKKRFIKFRIKNFARKILPKSVAEKIMKNA